MSWQTPSFVEINMNAEIGGYTPDFDDREPPQFGVPVVESHTEPEALDR